MQRGVRTAPAALGAVAAVVLAGCGSAPPDNRAPSSNAPTTAPTSSIEPAVVTPVIGSVVADPVRVAATDGKDHLAYELQLTNVLGQDVTLTSVAALTADKTLLTLAGDELANWTRTLGAAGTPTTTLGAGKTALVWMDIPLDRTPDTSRSGLGLDAPIKLVHNVTVAITNPAPPLLDATMTERIAPTRVQDRVPKSIAPPLTGPNWLDANSCCEMTSHRMAVNALNGGLWAAERFAIDFVQLQPDGRLFTGDRAALTSYPYYGTDIHAVADGPVVAEVDGLPDQVPGVEPTGLKLEEYGGNYIVQDIGGGNFAFYAHLRPGSVKVRPGEPLSAGQAIAALGNSGNSTGPHLHFHVMSTPDPLRADGLPFVLSQFQLVNRLVSLAALDDVEAGKPARMQGGFQSREESDVSPLVLDVMTFGNP